VTRFERLLLARRHPRPQFGQVEAAGHHLREQLAFFLAHMVVDVLAQHLHRGVVQRVVGRHGLDRGDEVLRAAVLHGGFVEQVLRLDGAARRGVEDLFLDQRVHGQHGADQLREFAAVLGGGPLVAQRLVLGEHLPHVGVVGAQQFDRVLRGGGCAGRARRRWVAGR
jgi:hypothetical protein